MNYEAIRVQVLNAAIESNKLGLIHGTSGNISVRDAEANVVAITPSNVPYDTMTPEDITIVDLDGNVLEGKYIPSSETPMHTAMYRARADINAVVHTHSLFATVMSTSSMEELPNMTVPISMFLPVKTAAPFKMPGSEELAQCVVETIGADGDVALLKNHGLLATGPNIGAAMSCAIYTEECAEVAYYAHLAGFKDNVPMETALTLRGIAKSGKAV